MSLKPRQNTASVDQSPADPVKVRVRTRKPATSESVADLNVLKNKSPAELIKIGESLKIEGLARFHKKDMIFAILKEHAKRGEEIIGSGVLEILFDNKGPDSNKVKCGFLRSVESNYIQGLDDIYVSPTQITRFGLRTGDVVAGKIRPPREIERYFALLQVREINQEDPQTAKNKILFENLTPLYANERLVLERGDGSPDDITGRVIDLASPLGKGQRGLIVSPPKAGKTMVLQNIARSITQNHPECYLIVLLVGERPEEVTDMKRSVQGEVVASTFDEPPQRHIQIAEMTIEKAKRLVENKRDVVILMDSITRLARAYNIVLPSSGKVLTGGIDVNAPHPPKRFFGAARNVEEGGSLTILATALIDTGSAMEEGFFQEFKGTGNMEIHLDRETAEKRIFPAINFSRSGTRREEYLAPQEELQKMWILRKILHSMDKVSGMMEFLVDRLKNTKTNAEFFEAMKK